MKKILIIEDDQQLQTIYHTKLTNEGFQVIQAFSGEEGINQAKSTLPHLIILDIMLPGGMDGFVVLDKLKSEKTTKKIPIIVATNIEDQAVKAIKSGAIWYFVKAHTPIEVVVNKIAELLK